MHFVRTIIIPLTAMASANPALADDSEEIRRLRTELDALKAQVTSANSNFQNGKLKIGGLIQTDARLFGDDNETDDLLIRRARIDVRGALSDAISFRILPEFSDGNDNGHLLDAYIDIKQSSSVTWRVGKFKSPIGIERVQSVPNLSFIERGLTDNLVPNRDVGVALTYQLPTVTTTLGVANNAGDRQDTDFDTDDGKALFWRLFWQTPLQGLGLGTSGSVGHTDNNASMPTYKSSGRSTIFQYADGVVREGNERRLAAHAMWYHDQFGSFAEFVTSESHLLNRDQNQLAVSNSGWQIVTSWMLTGEKNSWSTVTPASDSGAWELLFRISKLNIDDAVFDEFADAFNAVSGARSAAAGLNWHICEHLKVLLNYEHTSFTQTGADARRESERLLSARLQLAY